MSTEITTMTPFNRHAEATVLVTDNELLGKFLFKEDASAFEELVRRHSGLVMGVCRNMLFHSHDAEDAFQATFLILSRKCHSLLDHGSIAGWLYQTAMRNCLQIRRRKGRARETEMIEEPIGTNEPWQTISNAQETELIYQEINRLPKRYRDAIVLCHLQGHSRSEAAEFLDWTEAGVKAALARGRNLLRRRLIRSGLMTSVAIGMLSTSTVNAQAIISEPLISSTLQHCSGLNPTISVGNGAHLVQTISNTGVLSMQTATIIKSLSLAASIALAVCLPLALIAQQTELGTLSDDEIVSTIGTDQEKNVSGAASSVEIVPASGQAKDETVADALGGFDSKFSHPANQPIDLASKSSQPNPVWNNEKSAWARPRVFDEPGVYSKEDSRVYWELMLKSYTAQANSQHVGDKHDLIARKHEAEAKAVEARLNLKRIAAQSNKGTPNQTERSVENGSAIPPSAFDPVQPGEVLLVESLTDATLNRRVVVRSDHTISMPLIGTVSVKGQSTEEITQRVEARLVEFIKSPQIFVVRESASTPLKQPR